MIREVSCRTINQPPVDFVSAAQATASYRPNVRRSRLCDTDANEGVRHLSMIQLNARYVHSILFIELQAEGW